MSGQNKDEEKKHEEKCDEKREHREHRREHRREKEERRREKEERRREKENRSRSCSKSKSRSKSHSKSPKNKPKHCKSKSRSCSKSKSKSKSKSCSKSRSRSKSHSRSRSRSRSRSCSPNWRKYDWCDVYQYFKNRLVKDKQLMIAGSSCYSYMVDNISEAIQNLSVVDWNTIAENYNIDYLQEGAPFFVRESGYFIVFLEVGTAEACQFSIEVNGVLNPLTVISSNSGAGQVLLRSFLALQEDDNIVIRNNFSGITVNSNTYAGGTNPGNGTTITIFKIAPLCVPVPNEKKAKHAGRKHRKLFEKLECQLAKDCELMTKGYNVTGSFMNRLDQLIPLEGDVVFNELTEDHRITWDPLAPTQVKIEEDGVYNIFFQLNTQTAGQLSVTVNGVPNENTTSGINKGAGQITGRSLLSLHKGDILTLRNHSSNIGDLQITSYAGGLANCVSVLFMLYKISPLCKPCIKPVPCHVEKKLECLYPKFKNWLVCDRDLQIAGSSAFANITDNTEQLIAQNQPFYLSTIDHKREVQFRQGSYHVEIDQSGVYDLFATASTNEPVQVTIFVNGVAISTTNFGRDSGASRCYVRQLLALKRGDHVSMNNYLSASATVETVNSGVGNYVNNNVGFCLFKIHSNCEPRPCPPPCCLKKRIH